MVSTAASQVKMGFWIAGGFWLFGLVMLVFVAMAVRALSSS